MAKRRAFKHAADILAAYGKREAEHSSLANTLRSLGYPVYSEHGYKRSDEVINARRFEAYMQTKLERGGDMGYMLNVTQALRGTWCELTLSNGAELEHCFITDSSYTSGDEVSSGGIKRSLKRSEIAQQVIELHKLAKAVVFNPSIVPLTIERSSSVVTLNCSLAFARGDKRYLIHNARIHCDASLSNAVLAGIHASGERKLDSSEAAAMKALEQFPSELDLSLSNEQAAAKQAEQAAAKQAASDAKVKAAAKQAAAKRRSGAAASEAE